MTEKVKPIPDEYHSINVYIAVNDAAKAIIFYQQAFDAEVKVRFETPDGKVMYAELKIGDSTLQLSDEFPEHGCGVSAPHSINGTSCLIHLYVEDADATFEKAIQAGATVKRKMEDMFWGDRYGQIEDPFGHIWSIATKVEEVPPDELKKRSEQLITNHPSNKGD